MAGDAVAPSRLLRLGFRADVPHRQQVLARGARLDEVVAADRRVDGPLSSTMASTMEQALATHAGSEKDGVADVAAEGATEVDCWW